MVTSESSCHATVNAIVSPLGSRNRRGVYLSRWLTHQPAKTETGSTSNIFHAALGFGLANCCCGSGVILPREQKSGHALSCISPIFSILPGCSCALLSLPVGARPFALWCMRSVVVDTPEPYKAPRCIASSITHDFMRECSALCSSFPLSSPPDYLSTHTWNVAGVELTLSVSLPLSLE